ncbi:MAG: hypothetical protein R2748_17465 [Bryobacterales bacterium]
MDRVSRRNPNNVVHPTTREQLDDLMLALFGTPISQPPHAAVRIPNVSTPDFFRGLNLALAWGSRSKTGRRTWKWHVICAASPLLPNAFVDENFSFYGKT